MHTLIQDVRYYTSWRESPYLSWGYPNSHNIYCQTHNKDTFFTRKILLPPTYHYNQRGNRQNIEFLEQTAIYFTFKQTKLKDLILQDEREEVEW